MLRWVKLLFRRLLGESVVARKTKARSLAPLSKEAGARKRQQIKDSKAAQEKNGAGKVRVK